MLLESQVGPLLNLDPPSLLLRIRNGRGHKSRKPRILTDERRSFIVEALESHDLRKTLDPSILIPSRSDLVLCVVAGVIAKNPPAGEDFWLEGPAL